MSRAIALALYGRILRGSLTAGIHPPPFSDIVHMLDTVFGLEHIGVETPIISLIYFDRASRVCTRATETTAAQLWYISIPAVICLASVLWEDRPLSPRYIINKISRCLPVAFQTDVYVETEMALLKTEGMKFLVSLKEYRKYEKLLWNISNLCDSPNIDPTVIVHHNLPMEWHMEWACITKYIMKWKLPVEVSLEALLFSACKELFGENALPAIICADEAAGIGSIPANPDPS